MVDLHERLSAPDKIADVDEALYDFAGDTKAQIALYPRFDNTGKRAFRCICRPDHRYLHQWRPSPRIRLAMRLSTCAEAEPCHEQKEQRSEGDRSIRMHRPALRPIEDQEGDEER